MPANAEPPRARALRVPPSHAFLPRCARIRRGELPLPLFRRGIPRALSQSVPLRQCARLRCVRVPLCAPFRCVPLPDGVLPRRAFLLRIFRTLRGNGVRLRHAPPLCVPVLRCGGRSIPLRARRTLPRRRVFRRAAFPLPPRVPLPAARAPPAPLRQDVRFLRASPLRRVRVPLSFLLLCVRALRAFRLRVFPAPRAFGLPAFRVLRVFRLRCVRFRTVFPPECGRIPPAKSPPPVSRLPRRGAGLPLPLSRCLRRLCKSSFRRARLSLFRGRRLSLCPSCPFWCRGAGRPC